MSSNIECFSLAGSPKIEDGVFRADRIKNSEAITQKDSNFYINFIHDFSKEKNTNFYIGSVFEINLWYPSKKDSWGDFGTPESALPDGLMMEIIVE